MDEDEVVVEETTTEDSEIENVVEEIVEEIHEFSLQTNNLDLRFASESLKKRFSSSVVTSKLIEIYEGIL